ncbi:hypothetical protein Q1695_006629 [Nippostrongylus brasiliensis]|nr:hypothetical protein Q1695_006629 [Nippostrongylus brasiliensis]
MLLMQHAVERHLQCGGMLQLFLLPFELCREDDWRYIGTVCRKMAEFLSGPARGFDAEIIDSYSIFGDKIAIKHPAISLARTPVESQPSMPTDITSAEKKPHQGFDAYYLKDLKGKHKEFDHLVKQTGIRHNKSQESRSRGGRH